MHGWDGENQALSFNHEYHSTYYSHRLWFDDLTMTRSYDVNGIEECWSTAGLSFAFSVSESYPNITATQSFVDFQSQLEGTENRIGTARKDYTQAVKEYNNSVMKFPSNIFAAMFGFEKKPQFAADEAAQTAPTVEF